MPVRASVLMPPTRTAPPWAKAGLFPSTTKPSKVTLSAMMCSVSLAPLVGATDAAVRIASTVGSAFGPFGGPPGMKAVKRVLASWPACGPNIVMALLTTTASGYVPAATLIVSPGDALTIAAPIVRQAVPNERQSLVSLPVGATNQGPAAGTVG